jgi:hypothetical protein
MKIYLKIFFPNLHKINISDVYTLFYKYIGEGGYEY